MRLPQNRKAAINFGSFDDLSTADVIHFNFVVTGFG
jgi:hypothetical protein